jgi:hypothetical protein
VRFLLFAAAPLALVVAACGKNNAPDYLVVPFDAGTEAGAFDAAPAPDGSTVDPTLGGPCMSSDQCDDKISCTSDTCDVSLMRCRFVPDDSLCDDGIFCNGKEVCAKAGCAAGPVVTCEDGNSCTIDACVESTKSCTHAPRDADLDGDTDAHCLDSGGDCDDTDPLVSSKTQEVCGNGKDDNCNGKVDEQPCQIPANDTCANALAVAQAGSYALSTVATKKDYTASCSVKAPSAARDVVMAITAPGAMGDPATDIDVWVSADMSETAVSLESTCGSAASEIHCASADANVRTRARARSVPAGTTIYAIITTQSEAAVSAHVDYLAPTQKPTNEDCTSPQAIPLDMAVPVSIVDATHDLSTECIDERTGELTYAFTLTQSRDVHVFATTTAGDGAAVVSLRQADCTDESRCRVGNLPPLFGRSLAAGTYVVSVGGTASIDANLLVQTSAPTVAPANQTCASPPPAPSNATIQIDLSNQEDAIRNGCLPGAPNAAYDLELAVPSDVLIVARFPTSDVGAVSLNAPACGTADVVDCEQGVTPQRISKRNLAAGSYRIVVADQLGNAASLMVLTRPTVVATNVGSGSDACGTPTLISTMGGFYTGDTSSATADFDAGCDVAGSPPGGAPDQILKLALTAPQHVVFDMSGSVYATILDVRAGAVCPGSETPDGCYVGFGPSRSFLDQELQAGTYWVQIDGYNGAKGAWNLDVRVLPP